METHKVLSGKECHSRVEVALEHYAKTINIEAKATLSIGVRQIIPAVLKYGERLASTYNAIKATGDTPKDTKTMLDRVGKLYSELSKNLNTLEEKLNKAPSFESDVLKWATFYRDDVRAAMNAVRESADELEKIVDASLWPLPTYAEMLFLV